MSRVELRPIVAADCDTLLRWRNDPFIVERSLSKRTVAGPEHRRWFDALLLRSDVLAWIIEVDGSAAGHARAEARGPDWVLTVYLAQGQTAKGFGVAAIRAACRLCGERRPGSEVIAEVLPHNQPAQLAFSRAGFAIDESAGRSDVVVMVWRASDEEAATAAHYAGLLAAHGDSFRTLNWGSEAGQRLRFEVLAAIADLQGSSVLDVGCGLAHFADWLQERGVRVDYTGMDLVPALLDAAAARRPDLRLVPGSILDARVLEGERFDYVFASGIFATYEVGAEATLRATVARMWELARKGVAFNALSSKVEEKDAGEYYADAAQVLAFCRTLTPRARLVEGYHPRDFTIYLEREQRVAGR